MNLALCPRCSYFKRSHPELRDDIISRPILVSRASDRFYIVNGCEHAYRIWGPHTTAAEAERLWGDIVERLEADLSDAKKADLAEYEGRLNTLAKLELPELGQHELLR